MAIPDRHDRHTLQAWLLKQKPELSVAIAARAALRVLPTILSPNLPGSALPKDPSVGELVAQLFRAVAIARAAGRYPARASELQGAAAVRAVARARTRAAARARDSFAARADNDFAADAVVFAARAANALVIGASEAPAYDLAADAAEAAAAGAASYASGLLSADFVDDAALAARALRLTALADEGSSAGADIWRAISSDVQMIESTRSAGSLESPLWPDGVPKWAVDALARVRAALPDDQDWDVWFDWYEARLQGVWRKQDYEFVFATVPTEVWDKGAAAANRWIKEHLPPDADEPDLLRQQAAPFSFRLTKDGKIAVAPEDARAIDSEAARDFYDEARRKAGALKGRLERAQADSRLITDLALFDDRLGARIEDIRPGLLLSSLRSLESDHRAYDTEEGRKEHAPELIAMLDDLAGTVRDFVSQYPKARDIIANQLALEMTEEPDRLRKVEAANDELAGAAEFHPMLVAPEVPAALREPAQSTATARTTKDRAFQAGLRSLTAANFSRLALKAYEFAKESARQIGKDAPKTVSKVVRGTAVAVAGLAFAQWVGPTGMLLGLSTAVSQLNTAIGKRGGPFDRLLKIFEANLDKTQGSSNENTKTKGKGRAQAKGPSVEKPAPKAPAKPSRPRAR